MNQIKAHVSVLRSRLCASFFPCYNLRVDEEECEVLLLKPSRVFFPDKSNLVCAKNPEAPSNDLVLNSNETIKKDNEALQLSESQICNGLEMHAARESGNFHYKSLGIALAPNCNIEKKFQRSEEPILCPKIVHSSEGFDASPYKNLEETSHREDMVSTTLRKSSHNLDRKSSSSKESYCVTEEEPRPFEPPCNLLEENSAPLARFPKVWGEETTFENSPEEKLHQKGSIEETNSLGGIEEINSPAGIEEIKNLICQVKTLYDEERLFQAWVISEYIIAAVSAYLEHAEKELKNVKIETSGIRLALNELLSDNSYKQMLRKVQLLTSILHVFDLDERYNLEKVPFRVQVNHFQAYSVASHMSSETILGHRKDDSCSSVERDRSRKKTFYSLKGMKRAAKEKQ